MGRVRFMLLKKMIIIKPYMYLAYQFLKVASLVKSVYLLKLCGAFKKFPAFFVQAFRIVVDS